MKELIHKVIFNEKIEYLFWGAMTTLVYFIVRFASMATTHSSMIPVALAQIISTIFAFIVNKYLVFNGKQSQRTATQFMVFIIGRALAAALDFLLTFLMIDRFDHFFIKLFLLDRINYHLPIFSTRIIKTLIGTPILLNKFIVVILIQIIIIIINFIVSKYFAFK